MIRGFWGYPGVTPFEHHVGGLGIAGAVLLIILWVAVIAAIVIGIRALVIHSRRGRATTVASGGAAVAAGPYPGATPTADSGRSASLMAILEDQYARGAISRDEFLQRKQDLGLAAPVTPPPASTTQTTPETPPPPQAGS